MKVIHRGCIVYDGFIYANLNIHHFGNFLVISLVFPRNSGKFLWTSNRMSWVTQDVLTNWYTDYFCPTVYRCCDENNYRRRLLLLLDSAPGYPPNSGKITMTVYIEVECVLPNTTSL
jgi:hypothetical protein